MLLFKDIGMFPTCFDAILLRKAKIDLEAYNTSRNFKAFVVTYLSLYISQGVISTKQVLSSVLERGFHSTQIEIFIQELAKNIKDIQVYANEFWGKCKKQLKY